MNIYTNNGNRVVALFMIFKKNRRFNFAWRPNVFCDTWIWNISFLAISFYPNVNLIFFQFSSIRLLPHVFPEPLHEILFGQSFRWEYITILLKWKLSSDALVPYWSTVSMMTSSNGNIFRVTGSLCGEFTGPGEFPTQRPVTWSFDVFFDLRLKKRLSKQPSGWWFEPPSWSLWRHRNDRGISGWLDLEVGTYSKSYRQTSNISYT